MYALAFDLNTELTALNHSKGLKQAYQDIKSVLENHGFVRVQGSLYLNKNEDMVNLYDAMNELKTLSWFPLSVRDIRAFRVEQWSDFTPSFKRTMSN